MEKNTKIILENSKNLNVLYVEDDEIVRDSTLLIFENFFTKIDVAEDGQKGIDKYLDFYRENKTYYDLVISDINMPIKDGLTMCKEIKHHCIKQVIILVTAHNESDYLYSAIELGIDGYLTKPMELNALISILYRTTQVISDRKLVQSYYHLLEDISILNIDQKDASSFSSLKDILNDLKLNKEKILKRWIENDLVQERLEYNTINIKYFKTHYAINIINYLLEIIDGNKEIGNCPAIIEMLDFFKHKNLSLEDIFIICAYFKNSITSYIFSRYSFNQKVFDDISLVLDRNFEGVIKDYIKLKDGFVKKNLEKIEVSKETKNHDDREVFNYVEYVMDSDINELQDLGEEIDSHSVALITKNSTDIHDYIILGDYITKYGTTLTNYPIFLDLGKAIITLGTNLTQNTQALLEHKDKMLSVLILIDGFVNDLTVWRKEIFDNNIVDYKFLNVSFYSNIDNIIKIMKDK